MSIEMKTLTIDGVTYVPVDGIARTAEGTKFSDGETFQQKYDKGELKGEDATSPIVAAASTDGVAYTANVEGIDALVVGMEITIVPAIASTSADPTLNINDLGAKYLRCPIGNNSALTASGVSEGWLTAGRPVKVFWNGVYWITNIHRTDVNALYGTVPIEKGGTGATTKEEALVNLGAASDSEVAQLSSDVADYFSELNLKMDADQIIPITQGGTGATTAADARSKLDITPANIGAAAVSVYDPQGKKTDVFKYVDDKCGGTPKTTWTEVTGTLNDNFNQITCAYKLIHRMGVGFLTLSFNIPSTATASGWYIMLSIPGILGPNSTSYLKLQHHTLESGDGADRITKGYVVFSDGGSDTIRMYITRKSGVTGDIYCHVNLVVPMVDIA